MIAATDTVPPGFAFVEFPGLIVADCPEPLAVQMTVPGGEIYRFDFADAAQHRAAGATPQLAEWFASHLRALANDIDAAATKRRQGGNDDD